MSFNPCNLVYHWCLVPECTNTSVATPHKLWIQVPSEIKMRNTWITLARRDPKSLSRKTRLYFCEDHFDLENDMQNYIQYKIMGSVKRIKMKPNCVPSRFDCQAGRKHKTTPSEPRQAFAKSQRMSTIKEIEKTIQIEIRTTNHATELPSCSQAVCDMVQQIKTEEEIVDPTMNDAPPRFDPESVCHCCLSPSRSLGPLSRSPPWVGAPSVCARVCWECAATLARACRFRERVNAAEAALRRASETQVTSEIKSLSTLTSYTKDTYDYVFEFDYRLNETHKPKSGQRKQKLQAKVKSENTMDVFLPHAIEDHEIITHDIKKEPEYSDIEIDMIELFPHHNYYKTTANDATTCNNDLASDNNDATSDNIDAASDNNDVASYNNDAVIDFNDAAKDIDEPLVHVNVTKPNLGRECCIKIKLAELLPDHDYCDTTANAAITDNNDAASCNNNAASYNNDATLNNSDVLTDVSDAATDNDEPLVHGNVTQDLDDPLENEFEVKHLTEEEMRQTRFSASQSLGYKNRRFKCEMCICSFHTPQAMETHMKERHGLQAGRYVCRVCQQRFAAPGALAEHCRQHYVSYCCRRCGLTDRRLGSMKLHVRGHAPRQPEPKGESLAARRRAARPKYICDKCGLEYLWKFQIVRHFRNGNCAVSPPKTNINRECGICHETINYPMPRHYRTFHFPTERPRCRLCDKELTSQYGFVHHMQDMHMPRKYKCRFCNKLFSRNHLRQQHIDRMHVRTQKHKCAECGKVFSSIVSLKAHLKKVHEKVRTNLCMYCGFSLQNLTQLTEHLRTHTGERPYQCAHCHRAFAQRSNILSHIKSVHKELMRRTPAN